METNVLSKTIKSIVDQRLLDIHTNYIANIVSIDINKVTVQPLNMIKAYGRKAQKAAVIGDIPIIMPYKYVYMVDKETNKVKRIEQRELETGDTVYCGVCDRDITEAKKGNISAMTGRHHNLSDSVVIAGLSKIEYISEGDEE